LTLGELVQGVSRCPVSEIPDTSQVQTAMERALLRELLDGIEVEGIAQPEELTKYRLSS
jgi:hypothetical protein